MKMQAVTAPHEEGHKGMQKEKRQPKIRSFFIKSSVSPVGPAIHSVQGHFDGVRPGKSHKNTSKKNRSCLFIVNLFTIIFHLSLVSLVPIFFPLHLKFAHFSLTYPFRTKTRICSAQKYFPFSIIQGVQSDCFAHEASAPFYIMISA